VRESEQQQRERALWDSRAGYYDNQVLRIYEEAYRLTIEAILAIVNSSSNVLEMGCGTGIVTVAIAPNVREITGIDISPKMIAKAQEKALRQNIENVTFKVLDASELPFPDHAFDVVLLPNLLHLVAQPDRVIKESRRLLKPGGTLVTVTDCLGAPAPFKIQIQLLYGRLLKLFGKMKNLHFYKPSDLKQLLSDNGFEIMKEGRMHQEPINYLLIGRRK